MAQDDRRPGGAPGELPRASSASETPGRADGPSAPHTLATPGAAPGTLAATPGALEALDIAAPERIRKARHLCAATVGELGLREEDRDRGAGRTLSAAELRFVRAALTFLRKRGDIGEAAAVPAAAFVPRAEADLALVRLHRSASQVEATAAVGEILLGARLTAYNDRVFLQAREAPDGKQRERLRTYLASADLIYEREVQLAQGRRERAALRDRRQTSELQASAKESERLERREHLIEAGKRKETP